MAATWEEWIQEMEAQGITYDKFQQQNDEWKQNWKAKKDELYAANDALKEAKEQLQTAIDRLDDVLKTDVGDPPGMKG